MKLNNKGYAMTIIVFGILIVFIIVLSSLLITMRNSVKLNEVVKEDAIENIQLGADTTGMSLTERIEQLELQMSNIKQDTINEIYPVGSIYLSMNEEDLNNKFGGEWELIETGRTLLSAGTTTDELGNTTYYEVNKTGGSNYVTLNESNLPSHSHVIPILSGNTNTTGSHSHNFTYKNSPYAKWTLSSVAGNNITFYGGNGTALDINEYGIGISTAGDHAHTVATNASNTGTVGEGTSFSVQNPYITVYMYKRVK